MLLFGGIFGQRRQRRGVVGLEFGRRQACIGPRRRAFSPQRRRSVGCVVRQRIGKKQHAGMARTRQEPPDEIRFNHCRSAVFCLVAGADSVGGTRLYAFVFGGVGLFEPGRANIMLFVFVAYRGGEICRDRRSGIAPQNAVIDRLYGASGRPCRAFCRSAILKSVACDGEIMHYPSALHILYDRRSDARRSASFI